MNFILSRSKWTCTLVMCPAAAVSCMEQHYIIKPHNNKVGQQHQVVGVDSIYDL